MHPENVPTIRSQDQQNELNQQLIAAARKLDLHRVLSLLSRGANVNYTHPNKNSRWYHGEQTTALYEALHSQMENEDKYIKVVEVLLEHGADLSLRVRRGGWNHSAQYSMIRGTTQKIVQFQKPSNKPKFYELLIKYGFNLNQPHPILISGGMSRSSSVNRLIFQIMDYCHLSSRVQDLAKLIEQVDIEELKRQRQKKLYAEFNQENPRQQYQFQTANAVKINLFTQQKNRPDCDLIKQLLKMGLDPNSERSSSLKSMRNVYFTKNGRQFAEIESTLQETILHRAIMHNQLELVELLLNMGAHQKSCLITIKTLLYPNQWCEAFKQIKKSENQQILRESMKNVNKYEGILKEFLFIGEQRKLKSMIRTEKYQIFKAQRFCIESELPEVQYKNINVSCLQMAKKIQCQPKIIQLLISNNKNKIYTNQPITEQ